MRDIAKCAGNGCNIRESCARFVRPAVDRQTWLEPKWVSGLRCLDLLSIVAEQVEPHGGASEEGDAC